MLAVSVGTPLGGVAYPELGSTTFVLQAFVTMLPPMLAEVGALLWGRGSRAAVAEPSCFKPGGVEGVVNKNVIYRDL